MTPPDLLLGRCEDTGGAGAGAGGRNRREQPHSGLRVLGGGRGEGVTGRGVGLQPPHPPLLQVNTVVDHSDEL